MFAHFQADLESFLAADAPPVYVGFGSIPMRAAKDIVQDAIGAIRAQGRRAMCWRLGRVGADRPP